MISQYDFSYVVVCLNAFTPKVKIWIYKMTLKILMAGDYLLTIWVAILFGEGNGNLLQYSCLANPMDGGAW